MTAEQPTAPTPRRSIVPAFLIIAAITGAILVGIEDWRLLFAHGRNQPIGRDFLIFWLASSAIWHGDFAAVFDPWKSSAALRAVIGGPEGFTPFPYPPLSVWFIAPLAALPYLSALPVWLIGTFAVFAAVMRRFFARNWHCIAVLATAPASLVNIADGQNGFLSAALLVAGLLALERRPILAGVLIGLLTFKPQLGMLLPVILLAGGYYRPFLSAALMTVALFGASVLLLGWEPWRLYWNVGVPMQQVFMEIGTGPFVIMIPTFFMAARILELPLWFGYGIQGVVAVGVLIACCWAIRQKAPLEQRIAVVLVGALLAPPYCFNYDMTVLVAAQVIAWPGYRNLDAMDRAVFALAWLLPPAMVVAGMAHAPIAPIVLLAQFLVLIRRLAPAVERVSAGARSAAA